MCVRERARMILSDQKLTDRWNIIQHEEGCDQPTQVIPEGMQGSARYTLHHGNLTRCLYAFARTYSSIYIKMPKRGRPHIYSTWVQTLVGLCQKGVSSFTSSHYIWRSLDPFLAYLVHKSGCKTATYVLDDLISLYPQSDVLPPEAPPFNAETFISVMIERNIIKQKPNVDFLLITFIIIDRFQSKMKVHNPVPGSAWAI